MMREKLTPDKERERDLLLNDPEINAMLRNIIAMVETHGYPIGPH
jgi:hypothetical protein